MGDSTREVEPLSSAECRHLLGSVPVGRLVFTEGGLPAVDPVNFVLAGSDVIVRTGAGSKLDAAERGDVLAFQADAIDPVSGAGWSVLVIGHASVMDDLDRLAGVVDVEHRPWVRGRGQHVIQIAGERVTGRRLFLDGATAGAAVG